MNNSKERPEIVFWFDTPPKVSKGAFNYTSKHWGNKVYYICNFDYPEYRKKNNWNDGDFGNAEVIMLQNISDSDLFIKEFIAKHKSAIHILAGFTTVITRRIKQKLRESGIEVTIFSERPVDMGSALERYARKMYFKYKYSKFYREFNDWTKVFLPLGMSGVNTFAKYGWPAEKMFPFMYNPESYDIVRRNPSSPFNHKVKFLYVGRFYHKTKGTDVLMRACDNLRGDWSLDMVGGYGKNAEDVINWAKNHPNVNFIGSWKSETVCENMQDYDVVIIPSRYDGWNLLVNEAVNAHVGIITTNQAVSDEVVSSGQMGIVVEGGNWKQLRNAMRNVVDNPTLIETWKANSAAFAKRISPATVGEYFMSILDYAYVIKNERPICPWLN